MLLVLSGAGVLDAASLRVVGSKVVGVVVLTRRDGAQAAGLPLKGRNHVLSTGVSLVLLLQSFSLLPCPFSLLPLPLGCLDVV